MSEKSKPGAGPKKVTCGHCGSHEFRTKQTRVWPEAFDLRAPTEWIGTSVTAYVCTSCGHVEFFADAGR